MKVDPTTSSSTNGTCTPITPLEENGEKNANCDCDFSNKSRLRSFQTLVFFIVFLQLLAVCAGVASFNYVPSLKLSTQAIPKLLIETVLLALVLSIIILTVYGCKTVRKMSALLTVLLLVLVTTALALLVSVISVHFTDEGEVFLYSAGLTASISLVFALFSLLCQTTHTSGLTIRSGVGLILGILLIDGLIIAFLTTTGNLTSKPSNRPLIIAFIAPPIFGLAMLFDMKTIVSGNHLIPISSRNFALGALIIFIDLVLLFIILIVVVLAAGGEEPDEGSGDASNRLEDRTEETRRQVEQNSRFAL